MKSMMILVVLAVAALASATKVDYSGHMVIQVVPRTQKQLDVLVRLQGEGHDFWDGPNHVGQPSDIRVSPESYYEVSRKLATVDLSHTIRFTDIGKMIEDEEKAILLRRAIYSGRAYDFENYHDRSEVVAFLTELASTNSRVSLESIGTTEQGRSDIWMVRISTGANKPVMYFDCAMHSREWVTTASCVWMINELATKYGSDPDITKILDAADWLMVPISNPDGYDYTWTNDRMWRKNRQPNQGSICVGTDPNRNFDIEHCKPGASTSPCNDAYCGPSPFSAPEANAMRNVLVAHRGRVLSAVSIHSYSQYWMSPYGINSSLPVDYPEMYRVMDLSVKALEATYGTRFTYGTIENVIYQASGNTADYAYVVEKILYSYALELRDTGRYGFLLPADQILPTATETFNGLKVMALEIINSGYKPPMP